MKRLHLLAIAMLLPGFVFGSMRKMNISDAIKNNLVKLTAINMKGRYSGDAVRLTVTNNIKKDSLSLTVNLGVILKPEDSSYQPMVLAGEETLVLEPGKKGDVDVQVFCGDSPRHCPKKNLRYSFSRVGSDALVMVLRYINNHDLFDGLGQSAVWAITNNHSLGGVYDVERDSLSKKLIDTICLATGRAKPAYYTLTPKNETPGEAAYTAKTLKIIAPFDLTLRSSRIITAGVFDVNGHMIEKLFERRLFDAGHHKLQLTFDAEAYGAGNYVIRLMDSERMLKEKKVTVEE